MKVKLYNQNIWGNFAATECIGNRNQLICDLIFDYDADICGFQECNPATSRAQSVDIAKLLQPTYLEIPTDVGNDNFTPVFYRADRFTVVDSGWEKYAGKNDLNSKSITWCVLEEKISHRRLAYVSTHYWWMYDKEEDFIQRLENVDQVYALLQKIQKSYDVAVIMAGDLNCGENSCQGTAPIEKMKKLGLVNLADIAEKKEGHFTEHLYPIRGENDVYYGNFQPNHMLDFAFMLPNDRVCVREFIVDSSEKALSSSDHCPLKIQIEL